MSFHVLILGGTTEGRLLTERLATDARYQTLLSFAGRTRSLQLPSTPHRVGGFGGVLGLAAFLRAGRFDALIDATHPFAAQMSEHAVEAAALTDTPLIRLERGEWQAVAGDHWTCVADMPAAARALGDVPKRVFLTVGRLEVSAFSIAPQHTYLVRAIDAFDTGLPNARLLTARGPFALHDELLLLERERIEVVVSKNAGTAATYAKIEAARSRQLPVIMVRQPRVPAAHTATSIEAVVSWLHALHGASLSQRGE
jgi:precorrin-6A/cobalt-precorrin-6A reductase